MVHNKWRVFIQSSWKDVAAASPLVTKLHTENEGDNTDFPMEISMRMTASLAPPNMADTPISQRRSHQER